MKRVNVSEFRAHLSQYLAEVRGGETVVVCDRKTPIARLSPFEEELDDFVARPARGRVSDLEKIKGVPPREPVDVVAILRESRDQR
ncbi:MAG: type II toxin-antitoxin system prevent-host-death family antitoxin [Chloroflexi bacterium]|nr:type II toxin-antitoxin system prevent-host-death family antitoxin [Chloroflexota bacterium]